MNARALLYTVALIATVAAANTATAHFGTVHFLGFAVLAGTFSAGAALVLRDGVHEHGGRLAAALAVVAGAVLSWVTSTPALAFASGVTFLVAELADLFAYDRLRSRSKALAVAVSGAIGAPIDTLLFLHLAGFPIAPDIVAGQLLVKIGLSAIAALVILAVRKGRRCST